MNQSYEIRELSRAAGLCGATLRECRKDAGGLTLEYAGAEHAAWAEAGAELLLTLDGAPRWRGWVRQVSYSPMDGRATVEVAAE